jgi:hypothetical protein
VPPLAGFVGRCAPLGQPGCPAGLGGEEPGDERHDTGCNGAERLRRRTAFVMQARQPEREVELGVSDRRAVPIDEDGLAVGTKAQVVAPDVEMAEGIPSKSAGSAAASRAGSARSSQRFEHIPKLRKGSGSRATSGQPSSA